MDLPIWKKEQLDSKQMKPPLLIWQKLIANSRPRCCRGFALNTTIASDNWKCVPTANARMPRMGKWRHLISVCSKTRSTSSDAPSFGCETSLSSMTRFCVASRLTSTMLKQDFTGESEDVCPERGVHFRKRRAIFTLLSSLHTTKSWDQVA